MNATMLKKEKKSKSVFRIPITKRTRWGFLEDLEGPKLPHGSTLAIVGLED